MCKPVIKEINDTRGGRADLIMPIFSYDPRVKISNCERRITRKHVITAAYFYLFVYLCLASA